MRQEFIIRAKSLFDTPEKWNAFLELFLLRDDIRNQWYSKLKDESVKYFSVTDFCQEWAFKSQGIVDMQWYLTKHGEKSISLTMGWWLELNLLCDPAFFDVAKINEYLKTDKFKALLNGFERIDRFFEGHRIAVENRNYSFGSVYDTKFDAERLAWFAGNQTAEFIRQIAEKVNRYRKDRQMMELLDELNTLTKIE